MIRNEMIGKDDKTGLPVVLRILSAMGLMAAIFFFSSQNGAQSHRLSRGVLFFLESLGLRYVTGSTGMEWINAVSDQLLRKLAHFSLYFLLGFLLYWVFSGFRMEKSKAAGFSIACCFAYSVTDEIHQVFIRGRTFMVSDMLIDVLGAGTAVLLVYSLRKRKKRIAA